MELVIYGEVEVWDDAIQIITNYCPDITIAGITSRDIGIDRNDIVVDIEVAIKACNMKIVDGILMLNANNPWQLKVLLERGAKLEDIYVIPWKSMAEYYNGEKISDEKIIYRYLDILPEWEMIEYHLADHCNLNCKGCAHFSNLVPEPVFGDKAQFEKDLAQLSTFFSHLHKIFLLGGEPLLNEDLKEYISIAKKYFPKTDIIIVTNGILVLSMKDELLTYIKENNVEISISNYICLDEEKIINFLKKYNIVPVIRSGKEFFSKHINLEGNSNPSKEFYRCVRSQCTYLGKGKIAACCQPLVVHYFNEYFNEHIIEDEAIDLYEEGLNGWELVRRLFTPMESCRYCTENIPYEWEVTKAPFDKKDWCV